MICLTDTEITRPPFMVMLALINVVRERNRLTNIAHRSTSIYCRCEMKRVIWSCGRGSIIPSVGFVSSIRGNIWSGFSRVKSYRCKASATRAITSRLARKRPEQYVEPPPKGLKLGLRLSSGFSRNRLWLKIFVSGPNTFS